MDRFAHMVLAAARQAEADSGLDIAAEARSDRRFDRHRIGGLGAFQDCYETLIERGPAALRSGSLASLSANGQAQSICLRRALGVFARTCRWYAA